MMLCGCSIPAGLHHVVWRCRDILRVICRALMSCLLWSMGTIPSGEVRVLFNVLNPRFWGQVASALPTSHSDFMLPDQTPPSPHPSSSLEYSLLVHTSFRIKPKPLDHDPVRRFSFSIEEGDTERWTCALDQQDDDSQTAIRLENIPFGNRLMTLFE